ncbi:DUF5996 family protein [Sulfitobacter sp. D35]|uniref:DUF5996 family protein n=1 Tax=Sulfitobacter sp. D35 TaxID=3083252 RepID=UPI00296EEF6A|nr:DUF5996 family protein [Sulfitobacter sp. D35]MDW4497207.1 DUF5996 family protein [Sulfitobacter sp. D35]
MSHATSAWPDLDTTDWSATRDALHLYLQIVGKYRLARTPWMIHSWHATFYPCARGLRSGMIEDAGRAVEITFDFAHETLVIDLAGGASEELPLGPDSVAGFDAAFRAALRRLGLNADFHHRPNEIADPVPFAEDHAERPYDGAAVRRFHRALLSAAGVFEHFRTGFLGKSSPVHLFWGSFDLAVTRFSGDPAPLHPGGIPALSDVVTQEAYSHEVASAGFWPGGGISDTAAFYAYAYPTPEGFARAEIDVPGVKWHEAAGEFVLPYETVRTSDDPAATLLSFLGQTFDAACDLGDWDRERLTCRIGEPLRPRPVSASGGGGTSNE